MKLIQRTVSVGIFLSLFIGASTLIAQTSPEDESAETQEKTVYDFEGDNVTGELVKPTGENVQAEQHGKTSSLIDIRSDFVPEMLKTVKEF